MRNIYYLKLLVLVLMFSTHFQAKSQTGSPADSSSPVPVVVTPILFDISPPLISIPVIPPSDQAEEDEPNQGLRYRNYPFAATAQPQGPDPVWQQSMGTSSMGKAPLLNYEGNPNTAYPPDVNGEVSANYYFQAVNVSFQIYDKSGNSLYGPANNNTLWSGLPGASDNGSDPVVLFDQQAGRWFYADFTHYAPYYIRIAVSATSDPLGVWYRWVFSWTTQPDFAKYGVWSDGYYMASNTAGHNDIAVFNRAAMLAGNSNPLAVLFSNPWRPNSDFHSLLPFDNDGQWAPGGTPGQFITINDDAWGGSDQLWLYTLNVNWASPLSSSFTRSQTLAVAPFSTNFGPTWENIYQKGTSQRLDAVPQVLNHRAQYRNFGTYQSLVCNHTVDLDYSTLHAGVRWYELRNYGAGWSVYQQGTYAPDADSRWMASIAQNQYHDIALGFNVSSTNSYPSIRFTGRRSGDPLGTMTIAEQSIWSGSYSQTGGERWGDYSNTSVDPSDDKTFWHTGEYIATSGGARHTRIAVFSFGTACTASGGCDEYISRVQAGSIDNSTGCLNYVDYTSTQSTDLPVNGVLHVTVSNGPPSYSSDRCGIWVDWNRNGSFYDAGEEISVTGIGTGPFSATIVPPAGQTLGNCTMRIRINYGSTIDPCGVTTYGEVEDYTVNITSQVPNVWTGNFNNYWGNSPNWSLEHIPTADEDVIIPNVNMPCIVDFSEKTCNNLTLYPAGTLLIKANTLTVNGNMDLYGQLQMDNVAGTLNVLGDILWESGSTANISASSVMWIYGNWEFKSGCNVQLANGYVDFNGNGTAYIRTYAPNCSFNNVGVYKWGGALLGLSFLSTNDLTINGYLAIQPGATFLGASTHSLTLKGAFYNNNHFTFNNGTLILNGVNQTIKPGAGDFVNNLTINPSGATYVDNTYTGTFTVKGSLVIQNGIFNPQNNTVEVAGNWTNSVGPSAFVEGSGRVIFNGGAYHQYCSNETFNILEVDKPLGGAFRMNGTNVVCQAYDWTAGAIDVLSGSFTANDLLDNGLYGYYYVNTGGTINLTNNNGWVDLHGYIYIYGGNFNVWGGNGSDSFWPYLDNGGLTMAGGTLDFKNVGVYVNSSNTFTENITGGTIRTSRGFGVERSDYTPSGGTVEFYGATDGDFYTTSGGYVQNVVINKGVIGKSAGEASKVFNRGTSTITYAPLTSTVNVTDAADIKGNVTIQSGVLASGANTMTVGGSWNNMVGTPAFNEGTSTVEFNGTSAANILSSETFFNLNLNKTYAAYDGLKLMHDVSVTNDLHIIDGTMKLINPANLSVTGNLTIDLNAGLNAEDVYGPHISVGKDWVNSNTGYSGVNGFNSGYYSVVTFNGTADQSLTTSAAQESFNTLVIDKSAGRFRSNDNILCYADILISNGTWEDLVSGLTHSLYRNLTVSPTGSIFTTALPNTFEFLGSGASVLTYSAASGYFRNLLINKTTGYTVSLVGSASCQNSGNLTVDNGIFNLNGNSFIVTGDIAVNDAGVLTVPAASSLILVNGKTMNVNSGGRIEFTGTMGNQATVRANVGTARYTFNLNSGATIAADYGIFKNMGANGVYVQPGALVDASHSFRGCTFQDGASGGTLLALNNNQVMTIRNAVFPTNTWGGSSNVAKTLNTGHVYFVDYSGGFSGEAYDADGYNLIDWEDPLIGTATATPMVICIGGSSQLNVTRSGGLAPFNYQWSPVTGLSNPNIINPVANPLSTTTYSLLVTDALGTTATSTVLLTVNPLLPVSVSIVASSNPSPPGTYVTFTATPVNGGTIPAYQWKVNGLNVGTGLSTYSYTPSNNDQVSCVLTSNYPCVTGNPSTSNVITMIVVNTNTTVTGTVPSPLSLCFDATNTITVAGGGTTFLVQNGGSATMIAGIKISYLYGTTVQAGGYMHGYITSTNSYCGSLPPSIVSVINGENEIPPMTIPPSQDFAIYPNPTTGAFTLLHKGDALTGNVQVVIFDIRGSRILSTTYPDERSHAFTLQDLSPGMYVVKAASGDHCESFKLIITR